MIEIDQTNAANYHIFLKDTKLFTVFSVHKVYKYVCQWIIAVYLKLLYKVLCVKSCLSKGLVRPR